MIRLIMLFLVCGGCVASSASQVSAAEPKVLSATAHTYAEFSHSSRSSQGEQIRYQPSKDKVLTLVELQLQPDWKDSDSFQFAEGGFVIFAGKEKLRIVGQFQEFEIERHSAQPRGAGESEFPVWFRTLVEASPGLQELEIHFRADSPKAKPQVVPVKVVSRPAFDLAEYVSIDVKTAKLLDSLRQLSQRDDKDPGFEFVVENPGGKLLALTVIVTPKRANGIFGDLFAVQSDSFGLRFGRGGRAVSLGQNYENRILEKYAYPIEIDRKTRKFPSQEYVIYFPVPANLPAFDVTYFGQTVAKGTVSGTVAAEASPTVPATAPKVAAAEWLPGMRGLILVDGVPQDTLLIYPNENKVIQTSEFTKLLARHRASGKKLSIVFEGTLLVPADGEYLIVHGGGTSQEDFHTLYLNGEKFSSVGTGVSTRAPREKVVHLTEGKYALRWDLTGGPFREARVDIRLPKGTPADRQMPQVVVAKDRVAELAKKANQEVVVGIKTIPRE